MDPPPASSNGPVSVPNKYSSTFMNTFLWHFFQTLIVSSMLLMLLSIYYWMAFDSANDIRVLCVISVAFAIICPTFIVPNLPQIAAMAFPIIELYKNVFFQVLNIVVWMAFGSLYPLPANLLCYTLMAAVGLVKLYSTDGGSISVRLMSVIGIDALGISFYVFDYEKKHGSTGRWVKSSTGWSLLGLFAVTLLAHNLPPVVNPAEKKKMMMNEIEAILTEVAYEKKNVDHVAG